MQEIRNVIEQHVAKYKGGLNLYDYSARQYDPAIGQFTSMDPLCEKYYHISPYAYCAGNPVNYIDPDGRDSIFANNIKGMVFIGDDGKNTGDVYVVTGSVRRAVKKATKRGENYSGNLRSDNDHVAVIPRGEAAKQVNSDNETAHGREEGGCRYTDGSVQKWDSGSDPVVKVNADGTIEASHSITPYKVNGKIENEGTPDVSWHIHSTLDVPYPGGSVSLGSSEPSYADYTHEKKGTGSTFVVGQRDKTVQYYHNGYNTISMLWETWKRLAGM